jgi:hypothetical protein
MKFEQSAEFLHAGVKFVLVVAQQRGPCFTAMPEHFESWV